MNSRTIMWCSIAFAACLLAVSTGMLFRHRQVWRSAAEGDYSESERGYLYRQYRRRTQASVLIAAIGLAILGGIWVSGMHLMLIYWSGVMLLVVWMAWLAVADLVGTRAYFRRIHQEHLAQHKSLQAELSRLRQGQGNGRAAPKPRDSSQDQDEEDL